MRVDTLTLAVQSLERAKSFYASLGFDISIKCGVSVARAGTLCLALHTRGAIERHLACKIQGHAILSHNVDTSDAVRHWLERARAAGATVLREVTPMGPSASPQPVFAVFADPDGHVWEIAFNPAW